MNADELSQRLRTMERENGNRTLEVPEEFEETFETIGVSTEILKQWAFCEQQATMLPCAPHLPHQVRDSINRWVIYLCTQAYEEMGGSVFNAVLLLEVYRKKCPCLAFEALPAAAAAVIGLLRKSNTARGTLPARFLAIEATKFKDYLVHNRFCVEREVTADEIIASEEAILEALDWDVNMPSVRNWLWAMCERFNVLVRQRINTVIAGVFQQCMTNAMSHLQCGNLAAADELAPRSLANGLFCNNLVAAGLLPLAALRPEAVGVLEFEATYLLSQQGRIPRNVAIHEAHLLLMLEALKATTNCSIAELQADAYATAIVMANVFDASRMQLPPAP